MVATLGLDIDLPLVRALSCVDKVEPVIDPASVHKFDDVLSACDKILTGKFCIPVCCVIVN